MSIFNRKEIKSAKFMGVTNQCVDFKLHPILNFQEDIYANVYTFYVTYTDNTSKTIQTYDEKEISHYMQYTNQEDKEGLQQPSVEVKDDTSILDNLSKLKLLHDEGVIPDELFEKKRKELLSIIETNVNKSNDNYGKEITHDNIIIHRGNVRSNGESKTILILDDEKMKGYSTDHEIKLNLSQGEHTICFQRAAMRSKEVNFTILGNEKYRIIFTPKMFNINVEIIKC